ncbi:hypothetical protein ACFYZB_30690 [Streptomyces sp. NPDC001852]|uniref:hypothetical protein n=1 Tax=Streptomyces sp. NPDC001852 TaxID=3364619 RepID=UPI0036CE2101
MITPLIPPLTTAVVHQSGISNVMRIRTAISAVLASSLTAALAVTSAPAFAAGGNTATQAAAVVQKVTGTQAIAASTTTDASPAQATKAGVTVTAPGNASGQVAATAPGKGSLSLGLPGRSDVEGVKTGQGTVVYPDAAKATDLAVQPSTDGGASTLITLKNAQAPTTQRFTLNLPVDTKAVEDGAGGYLLLRALAGGAAQEVGRISAPWAKDANGKPVPTHYTLEGNQLIQTVETASDTAFPVVADPHFTWGIITGTAYFNKHETEQIALGGATAVAIVSAVGGPFDLVIDPIVGLAVAQAALASHAGKCVEIKSDGIVAQYKGGYCK